MHLQDLTAARTWLLGEKELINILKIKAVQLSFNAFPPKIMDKSLVLMSDSTILVWHTSRNKGSQIL